MHFTGLNHTSNAGGFKHEAGEYCQFQGTVLLIFKDSRKQDEESSRQVWLFEFGDFLSPLHSQKIVQFGGPCI